MTNLIPSNIRFADIVHAARLRRASDVHVTARAPIALRVDGSLQSLPDSTFDSNELQSLIAELLPDDARSEYERYGDVTVTLPCGDDVRARLHVLRSAGYPVLAIRLLDGKPPSLASLELPTAVSGVLEKGSGLVLISGPTGCGKSSTLAALVEEINAGKAYRIITVEDPIEYEIVSRESFVTQREIGCDAPSLEAALIGALRADPDVLVVGEVRDAKSMRAVLTAAETGHLVLATLHTGTASETVERVTDMFDGPMQARARIALAETLIAVVCQRLVKRPNAGRRAVVEMLVATPAVRSIIRQSKTHLLRNTIATGRQHGMQTFAQHAQELLACGEISAAVAARFIESSMAAA